VSLENKAAVTESPNRGAVPTIPRILVLSVIIALLVGVAYANRAHGETAKPALYFFVIDRSGSIKQNQLIIPIRGALIQKLGEIPESAEVRMVLFDHKADRRASWQPMDMVARGELSAWFDQNFPPGRGDTRLYDTVADALLEIEEIKNAYSMVQLTILSDGIEQPPVSTNYRSWKDLEPLSKGLKQSDPPFFGTWYTLGFDPPDEPGPGTGIERAHVPDPKAGFEIAVVQPPPSAEFKAHPQRVEIGEDVLFTPVSDAGADTYEWHFGDGSTSSLKQPTHAYAETGTYDVTLRIGGPGGEDRRECVGCVQVLEKVPLKAAFDWAPSKAYAGEAIRFIDESEGSPESIEWDFPGIGTRTEAGPQVVFPAPESVTVTLTVRRATESDHISKKITIHAGLAKADFSVSRQSGRIPFTVQFSNESRGDIVKYHWDFDDGTSSDLESPSHVYRQPGEYRPRLTITNVKGIETKSPGNITIQVKKALSWWIKPLIGVVAAILVWVLVIVPLILKPLILPHKGAALTGTRTHNLRHLARKLPAGWLVPRGHLRIGQMRTDSIKVGRSSGKPDTLARIGRVIGTRSYRLTPLVDNEVFAVRTERGLDGKEVSSRRALPRGRHVMLRDATQYEIHGESFTWVQPRFRGRTKRPASSTF